MSETANRIPPILIIVPVVFGAVMVILTRNLMFLGFAFMSPVIVLAQSMERRRRGKK